MGKRTNQVMSITYLIDNIGQIRELRLVAHTEAVSDQPKSDIMICIPCSVTTMYKF